MSVVKLDDLTPDGVHIVVDWGLWLSVALCLYHVSIQTKPRNK